MRRIISALFLCSFDYRGRGPERQAHRTGAGCARPPRRRPRRHAVGHLLEIPQGSLPLAGSLAAERRADQEPAPHLSRPGRHPRPQARRRPAAPARHAAQGRAAHLLDERNASDSGHPAEGHRTLPGRTAGHRGRRADSGVRASSPPKKAVSTSVPGNKIYAKGIAKPSRKLWQIYRPGTVLKDPDTDEVLGYEAIYLGRRPPDARSGRRRGDYRSKSTKRKTRNRSRRLA